MLTRSLLAALAISLAACGGDDDDDGGPTTPNPQPAPSSASVQAGASANTFTPSQVTIARNGTVTWSFGTRTHNVDFGARAGAPANIPNTASADVSRTFSTSGSYPYDCTLHSGMSGTVVVQ